MPRPRGRRPRGEARVPRKIRVALGGAAGFVLEVALLDGLPGMTMLIIGVILLGGHHSGNL